MTEAKHKAPAAAATIGTVEAMAKQVRPMTLSEISAATGINKNMISRILHDLTDAGWVVADGETGKYSLTLQLFRLGSAALGQKTLCGCAGPYLERLNELTGECIQLALLEDGKALYVAQRDCLGGAGVRGRVGMSYPLDTTAPGKILKAFVLRDGGMDEVRSRGYATDDEEYCRGVVCVAAPVFDYTGEVVAALGIASLTIENSVDELVNKHLAALLKEAEGLSRELGHDGSAYEKTRGGKQQ